MFVRYADDGAIHPGEAEISEQIAATLLDIAKKVGERQRHTVRAVHAKSHGLLKRKLQSCLTYARNYGKVCSQNQQATA